MRITEHGKILIRDTSLQPLIHKNESFDIKLKKDITTVDVIEDLKYELVPESIIPIHKITRHVTRDK